MKTTSSERYSPQTVRAYTASFRAFEAFCIKLGLSPMPASTSTVVKFIHAEAAAGLAPATIQLRLSAIRHFHMRAGVSSLPLHTVDIGQAILEVSGPNPPANLQCAPANADCVARMMAGCPDNLMGLRDRAVLAFGFAGAFRRSELAALEVADLKHLSDGVHVTIRKSKTDQAGAGQQVVVPQGAVLRPVSALTDWLQRAAITHGPIFRRVFVPPRNNSRHCNPSLVVGSEPLDGGSIARIVKRCAAAGGLDADTFSGHSLRAGFLTSAAEAGVSVFQMMQVSRHVSASGVQTYVRQPRFRGHAGDSFL